MYTLLILFVLMFLCLYTVFVHTYTKHIHAYMYISRHLVTHVRMYGVYTSQIVLLCVYLSIVSICPLQSTTNSHSVVANMQKAVSLMKVHSHALCGAIASSALQREAAQKSKDTRTFNPSGSLEELQRMLGDLEREFAELAW